MSDFFGPKTEHVGRKVHRCIFCGQHTAVGSAYFKQSGVWDGVWFTGRYHPECWVALADEGNDEFSPYSNERPVPLAVQTTESTQ